MGKPISALIMSESCRISSDIKSFSADPNQTDRIIRYISKTHGNFLVAMGRSTNPILLDDKGTPLFGASYEFRYGHADLVREGKDAAILTTGEWFTERSRLVRS